MRRDSLGRAASTGRPSRIDVARLRALWEDDVPISRMCALLDCCEASVKYWRARLGLQPRLPGARKDAVRPTRRYACEVCGCPVEGARRHASHAEVAA